MSRRRPELDVPDWRHMALRDRLLSQLIIDPSGCLIWTGSTHRSRGGAPYGQIQHQGQNLRVHRVMYEMFAEPIPEGMEPDHLCRNTLCANVAHLEPVTHRENLARAPGSSINRWGARTRCDAGHLLDEANTYHRRGHGRRCRKCHNLGERRRRVR